MHQKKHGFLIDYVLGIGIGVALIAILYYNDFIVNEDLKVKNSFFDINSGSKTATTKFGYLKDSYLFESNSVKKDDVFGNLLYWHGVSFDTVEQLIHNSKGIFDVKSIQEGKPYTIVRKKPCGEIVSFIYEPDIFSYVVFNVADSVYVRKVFKETDTKLELTEGEVENSLWGSMENQGISTALIDNMQDALASEVDFYHTNKGDKFKLLYERKFINDKPATLGKLLGAIYENDEKNISIYFEKGKYKGYYNEKGYPSAKSFLKSPVRFSRISSGFNLRRFHPILHINRAHFGTDFAAPYGTPIMTVGDGQVVEKGYGRGNGNYVTVKHDSKFTTTYLHMSRFARIHVGSRVKQGQVIGFVGSTGLATGPHVCFRMKKNGAPVNSAKIKFDSPDPLPKSIRKEFFAHRDSILTMMNEIEKTESSDTKFAKIQTKAKEVRK